MSITDELREYAWQHMTNNQEIRAIADRIDAEHQKALDEWKAEHGQMWLKGYAECHAELLEGNETLAADLENCGWVRLPVDADGVPIRFGDKVTVPWKDKVYEVAGFSYSEQLCSGIRTIWIDVYSPEKQRNVPLCGADSCRHHHAPTVEDVLREFARVGIRIGSKDGIEAGKFTFYPDEDMVAEYAAKLRLAEGRTHEQ